MRRTSPLATLGAIALAACGPGEQAPVETVELRTLQQVNHVSATFPWHGYELEVTMMDGYMPSIATGAMTFIKIQGEEQYGAVRILDSNYDHIPDVLDFTQAGGPDSPLSTPGFITRELAEGVSHHITKTNNIDLPGSNPRR